MELRQLRYYVRIIETGSMGRAALDLNIGVSALSQQMARLENELAIRLLQRTSRGVMPTSAGLAFYSRRSWRCATPTMRFRRARGAPFRPRQRRYGPQHRLCTGGTFYSRDARKLCRRPPAFGREPLR